MNKATSLFAFILVIIVSCTNAEKVDIQKFRNDYAYELFVRAKNEKDIDRKLNLLALANHQVKSASDTLLYDILDYQIYYHDLKRSYDSSLYYSNEMINKAATINDTSNLAKGYYRKARTFLYLNKQEQVLENMYRSQSLYKSIHDSVKAGKRLVELANAQDRLGDFTGSHQTATDALNYIAVDDSIYLASVHTLLALTSSKLDDYESSIKENKKALKYVKSRHDSLVILNNIGVNYRRIGNFKKADEVFETALSKAQDTIRITWSLRDNYFYNQYLKTGENVITELEGIAVQRKKSNDIEGLLSSYKHLSTIYQEHNLSKAKQIVEQYLNTAKAFGNPLEKLQALEVIIQLNKENLKEDYVQEYFYLNDSINTSRNKIKNLFAKIKFDEEQKLKEIESLEHQSAASKLEAEKEKTQKIVISVILFFLLLAAFILYYLIQQKHKRDKIKEIHDTEARLSKKVHDELANDIFQIMTDPAVTESTLIDRLDNVYHRTRDISKENNLIHTGSDFSDELQGMISSTVPSSTKVFIIGLKNIEWDFYNQEKKIVIYRVIQELLVNFRKHSKATRLTLRFENSGGNLNILYKDNGQGTDLKNAKFSGLRNMENRIHLIDGSITFQSKPGSGFSCQINIRS
ncbi:tetratricopeptide repeat-containing sensor histidine kinase [Gramella sp. BOM4]|nr:tetratricopeptide repeat-containing sensor histidine kinase [Christiangramia bathymodioli]